MRVLILNKFYLSETEKLGLKLKITCCNLSSLIFRGERGYEVFVSTLKGGS